MSTTFSKQILNEGLLLTITNWQKIILAVFKLEAVTLALPKKILAPPLPI